MVGVYVEVIAPLAVERACEGVAAIQIVLCRGVVALVLLLVCGVE